MKKLMSVLLALALVLAMVPVAASAADGDVAQVGNNTYPTLQAAVGVLGEEGGAITLLADVELSEQVTLPANTTLNGADHTISVADSVDAWSSENSSKYMLLCTGTNTTIQNVTVDAEGNAYGCIQFYATTGGKVENVTLKNAQQLGLLVNASQVTATGTLTLAGNGWGDVINVGWGSGIPATATESSFVADGAELVGVSSIYSDKQDMGNAETASKNISVTAPESFGEAKNSEDGSVVYARDVAQVKSGDSVTPYPTLEEAIAAAESGDTITLLDNITAEDVEDAGKGTAAFTIPAGVTLDGAGHTITASATWTAKNHPILGVTSGAQDVTTKIQNLTIEGNGKSGHGINVWNANNVAINDVKIYNCGTAGVVINNSTVTASGLQTSGNAWGAVNVDKGSAFTLTGTNELAENVQVYSEDAGKEDGSKITTDLTPVTGVGGTLKGYTYYTSDVSKLGEATITTDEVTTVYEKVEDAISQAKEGETVTLTKDVTVEDTITIGEGVTLDGNGKTITYAGEKKETNPSVLILANSGADNVTVKNVTLDTNGNLKHGVEFFATDKGKLSGVTVNGGSWTSVQVNGSTGFTIENCVLNPGDDAYANIEYCLSESAQNAGGTTPSMTIENVTFDSTATYEVWADATTVEKIKEELEKAGVEDPTVADVKNAISENVATENSDSVTITVGLKGNTTDTITKPSTKPSTPGGTPSEPEEPTWPFTDVTEGDDWFYDAVAYVYENGIMAGTSETTFEPYMELNRAQAAQLFYNLEGKPTVTGDSTFTDVTSGHWAVEAITWAAENEVVAGIGEGLYDPDSNVTREQFAQMLYNYAKYKGYDLTATGDLTQFPDAGSISSWAETALSWANGNDLINGHENGTIDPKGSTIRAQAASIMANFDQNVAK